MIKLLKARLRFNMTNPFPFFLPTTSQALHKSDASALSKVCRNLLYNYRQQPDTGCPEKLEKAVFLEENDGARRLTYG
jgi:hypothetical protein